MMKKLRKMLSLIIAAVTIVVMVVPVSAEQIVDTGGGGTASITVTNTSQGQTYTLYKLFNATQSDDGISYTVPNGKSIESTNAWFEVDNAGNVLQKTGANVATDEFKTWAEGFGTKVTSVKATGATVTFDKLAFGYYFIKSSLGAVLTVDSTNPNATVIDKNETEPIIPDGGGKKVQIGASLADTATAKIGEILDFKVIFQATNFITKKGVTTQITKFTIEDVPTALSIQAASISVTVAGSAVTPEIATVDESTGKMTIELKWANSDGSTIYASPAVVEVSYKAIVTKDAQEGTARNQATIKFNDKDLTDEIIVNTYKITLSKVNNAGNTLTGAQFRLYDAEVNGHEIPVVKNNDGTYRVAEAGETGVPIDAGTAVIKGLKGNTSYWLEETKAPAGYNRLTSRQEVVLQEKDAKVEIVNQAGTELPSTGAMGTSLLYIIGTVLALGSAVLLVSKRRMQDQ